MKKINKLLAIAGLTALSTIGLASNESTKEYTIIPSLWVGLAAGSYYQVKREEKFFENKKKKEFQKNFLERYFKKYGMIINETRDQEYYDRELIKIKALKVFNTYNNTLEMISKNKNY